MKYSESWSLAIILSLPFAITDTVIVNFSSLGDHVKSLSNHLTIQNFIFYPVQFVIHFVICWELWNMGVKLS